jgi:multidrug resistance efflux pump
MTDKEFKFDIEEAISKMIAKATRDYNKLTELDDEHEWETEDLQEDTHHKSQAQQDYEDDLKDRYHDMKGL